MIESMFHLHLPVLEKILRPVIVYLFLIGFLRLFGKRELAQLNPFDLVVLLSLSNTVQNAMIGDDNSVTGGVIGAFALLAINWVLTRILFRMPKLNSAFEGTRSVLIRHGVVDWAGGEEGGADGAGAASRAASSKGTTTSARWRSACSNPTATSTSKGSNP